MRRKVGQNQAQTLPCRRPFWLKSIRAPFPWKSRHLRKKGLYKKGQTWNRHFRNTVIFVRYEIQYIPELNWRTSLLFDVLLGYQQSVTAYSVFHQERQQTDIAQQLCPKIQSKNGECNLTQKWSRLNLWWLSRLSDVLPPLRSWVRALYHQSDRTWEEFVNSLPKVVSFLRVLRFLPTKKLDRVG